MEINFIITCFDKEEYWPHLKEILDSFSKIKPNYVLVYNGENENFICDARLKNEVNAGRGNRAHEHACLYAENDWFLTKQGYDLLKDNGVTKWIKLSVDSWMLDEQIIIDLFQEMLQTKSVYGGNVWYSPINYSTDIFFLETSEINLFEEMSKNSEEFFGFLYRNEIPTGFENFMSYHVIPHNHLIFLDREELDESSTRWRVEKLGWTMSHQINENHDFRKKYKPIGYKSKTLLREGNGIPYSRKFYLEDTGLINRHKLVLGLGHPRTGTGHTARIMKSWGLRVSHEGMDLHGIVAWQLAPDAAPPLIAMNRERKLFRNMYVYDAIVYNVRDPFYSLPSIAFSEIYSLEWRSFWGNFKLQPNILTMAIESLLSWDNMIINKNPNITYRIEDQDDYLYRELEKLFPDVVKWTDLEVNKAHNSRPHDGWDKLSGFISDVPHHLLEKLNDYAEKYGYQKVFNTQTYELENTRSVSLS